MSVVSDEALQHPLYRVDQTGIPRCGFCGHKSVAKAITVGVLNQHLKVHSLQERQAGKAKIRVYSDYTWKEVYFVKVFHTTVYYKHLRQQKENEAPFSNVKLLDEDQEKTHIKFLTLVNLPSNASPANINKEMKEFGVEMISYPKEQPFPKKAFFSCTSQPLARLLLEQAQVVIERRKVKALPTCEKDIKNFGLERLLEKKSDQIEKKNPSSPKGPNDDILDFNRTFTVTESPLDVVGESRIDSFLLDHIISLRSENLSRMKVISINRHLQSIYDITSTPTPPPSTPSLTKVPQLDGPRTSRARQEKKKEKRAPDEKA